MIETLAALTTVAVFAGAVRLTWLALMDQRITPRTLVGLPRRRTPAMVRDAERLARTVDRMPERDEHERAHGIGGMP